MAGYQKLVKQLGPLNEVNCFEACENGDLILYVALPDSDGMKVTIPAHDVSRMMTAGIDALQRKQGRL